MYLAELSIENFRGIRSARVLLERRTLLLGPNNAGKTTLLEAAALLLGRDRMAATPSEWDFYNGWVFDVDKPASGTNGEKGENQPEVATDAAGSHAAPSVGEPAEDGQQKGPHEPPEPIVIRISGVLAGLSAEEKRVLCNPSSAGSLQWWCPNRKILQLIKDGASPSEPAVRVSYMAYFDVDAGEVVSYRYFPLDGEDSVGLQPSTRMTRRQVQAAGYYLLPATRLWKDAVRFSSSIFSSLLRQREVRTGSQVRLVGQALARLEPKIQHASEVRELLAGLRKTVGRFVPLAKDDPLGFEVTDLSSPDVERALTLFLRGRGDDQRIPMGRHGSAAISVQILAMLVMLGTHRREKSQSFILGLEEPELHLHPHAQRNLVRAVGKDASQLIATTHSPSITECFDPAEICIVSSDGGTLSGHYLLNHQMKRDTKNAIKRWVFTHRRRFSEALMAPAVLLVEGITEEDLLPVLSSIGDGESLDSLGCTVVEGGGSELLKILPLMQRFPGTLVVLVDGDRDGDKYVHQLRNLEKHLHPNVIIQLPKGRAFELALAHGLDDQQACSVAAEIQKVRQDAATVTSASELGRYFVDSKMKKDAPIRSLIARSFDECGLEPPIVSQVRDLISRSMASPAETMQYHRLT